MAAGALVVGEVSGEEGEVDLVEGEEEDLVGGEVGVVATLTSGQETGLARIQGKCGVCYLFFTAVGFTLGFFTKECLVSIILFYIITFQFGQQKLDRTGKRGEKGREGNKEEMRRA